MVKPIKPPFTIMRSKTKCKFSVYKSPLSFTDRVRVESKHRNDLQEKNKKFQNEYGFGMVPYSYRTQISQ